MASFDRRQPNPVPGQDRGSKNLEEWPAAFWKNHKNRKGK